MAKRTLSPDVRRAIAEAQRRIEEVTKLDGNEAETRRRVERIFESVMGYDIRNLSREHAIKGSGTTEHVDFAIQIERGQDAKPVVIVELKRVGVDLAPKHLRQASSYAINAGCEWVLLTNGREWRIYHVEFGQPPVTKLVDHWNLLKDDKSILASKFELLSMKKLRRGSLDDLWEKTKVLAPDSILAAMLSPDSLRAARRVLRKKTSVLVDFDDLVSGFKRLLNEAAAKTLDGMQMNFVRRKRTKELPGAKTATEKESGVGQAVQVTCEICGSVFSSEHALATHKGLIHQKKESDRVSDSATQAQD